VVAFAAVVGAALAGAHPTANRASDVVLAAGFAVVVVAATSIARTWSWMVLAGTAAVAGTGLGSALGLAALALAFVAAVRPGVAGRRLIGAAVGALSVQALLRVDGGRFAVSALVAGAAAVIVTASGWRLARKQVRDHLRHAAYGVAGLAAGVAASFGLSVLQGRSSVEVGVRRAQEGLDAARGGDTERAADLLDQSSRAFGSAHGEFSSWWNRPARLLPIVGAQARALELVSGAGAEVAASAAESARSADVQSLHLTAGRLDLDRVAAMNAPLQRALVALEAAQHAMVRSASPWLVPPIAGRIATFDRAVGSALDDVRVAAQAVAVAPALLGGDGPRHYLLLFATPAETRDLGGFTGGYGELVADAGHLELVRNGKIADLNAAGAGRHLTDPSAIPARMRSFQLDQYWQNVTASPDFPTVAEAARQLWPQSGGGPLDGVMYVDPAALAGILALTGPVTVDGYDRPLAAKDVVDFVLRGQYAAFDVTDERKDFLVDVARAVFNTLTTRDLPGPRTIADALAPAAQQRHLLLHSFHPAEQALFERVGIDGALPAVGAGDIVTVRTSDLGLNKVDAYLERTVDYAVTVDPGQGSVNATLTMKLHNGAPASGLPDYVIGSRIGRPPGTNSLSLAVFTPLDLVDATANGSPLATGSDDEYGRQVHAALLDIPPGGDVTVVFRLRGGLRRAGEYDLTLVPAAGAHDDQVTVTVKAARGWAVDGGGATLDIRLVRDEHLTVRFRRA
jgi:hypothetical protein